MSANEEEDKPLKPFNTTGEVPSCVKNNPLGKKHYPTDDIYWMYMVDREAKPSDPEVALLAHSYELPFARKYAENIAYKAIAGTEWDYEVFPDGPTFSAVDKDGNRRELPTSNKFMMWDGAFEDRRAGNRPGFEDRLVVYKDGGKTRLFDICIAKTQETVSDIMATETDGDRAFLPQQK